MYKSILIANRGEIAVRIQKTCKKMGIRTVQIFSEADEDSLAVKLADKSILVGPAQAAQSYLQSEKIVKVAVEEEVDAIHPGYGFLSENAAFAKMVEDSKCDFIGPSADTISLLGDKARAREEAIIAGLKVVPGTTKKLVDIDEATEVAETVGYPVMLKAAAGGGGRGIRIVENRAELAQAFAISSAEAEATFGDGNLYLEKVIKNARHIEVQIAGDGENFVHFYERDCSIQRRRQKVWEEAPAVCLDGKVRERVCEDALSLVSAVNYKGVGTVEFLYDQETDECYFIEVNTRIQVEHPVTEMITGLDLIELMINISSAKKLNLKQQDIKIAGHSIECRINAEDPENNFFPSPGRVDRLVVENRSGVRFDTMLFDKYVVTPFYDSLVGKLVVHAKDRPDAIKKLKKTLGDLRIEGISTTIPLHLELCSSKVVIDGDFDTEFLERYIEDKLKD